MKYKVGDKVVRLNNGKYNGGTAGDDFKAQAGEIGTVRKIWNNNNHGIDCDRRKDAVWTTENFKLYAPTKLEKALQ